MINACPTCARPVAPALNRHGHHHELRCQCGWSQALVGYSPARAEPFGDPREVTWRAGSIPPAARADSEPSDDAWVPDRTCDDTVRTIPVGEPLRAGDYVAVGTDGKLRAAHPGDALMGYVRDDLIGPGESVPTRQIYDAATLKRELEEVARSLRDDA